MEDLSCNIQKIRDQIVGLEADKLALLSDNSNDDKDVDIAVIDNEIMELEIQLENKLSQLSQFIEYQSCCNHVFVDDLIDIDPDRSMAIKYCVDCLFTQ